MLGVRMKEEMASGSRQMEQGCQQIGAKEKLVDK